MADFIDELMALDPSKTIDAFQDNSSQSTGNPNIYKTNPLKVSKDVAPDGHYRAKVRLIYNPFDISKSIVRSAMYKFTDSDGFFMLDSKLAMNDRSCRIFKDWKSFHFSQDPELVATLNVDGVATKVSRKQWGDAMFNKSELQYALVQVIEDANQPELVGKFMIWKLPKFIFDLMNARMNPTDKSETPQDLLNYLFGPVLKIDVTPGPDDPSNPERKQREIKYNLCTFDSDPTPIIKVTGENLFSDDELDMINDYMDSKKILINPKSTAKKKTEATEKCKSLVDDLKKLMSKALDYAKENAIDIVEEVGYKEPTAEQWKRYENWLSLVQKFVDPATYVDTNATFTTPESVETQAAEPQDEYDPNGPASSDDLPF